MNEANPKSFHLHLVSDSTGETVGLMARACMAQFENIKTTEHFDELLYDQSPLILIHCSHRIKDSCISSMGFGN